MTAWWTSTTRVRKVRARSSARLRVAAFGAALTSAGTAVSEIDVMHPPARWLPRMLPPGAGIGKNQLLRQQKPSPPSALQQAVQRRSGRQNGGPPDRERNQFRRSTLGSAILL